MYAADMATAPKPIVQNADIRYLGKLLGDVIRGYGGQALFDARNPIKLIARASEPFIKPTEPYERTGQYVEGTTFVEGLVPFNGRWYLYYGTADSRVGVAVWEPKVPPRR